jgi:hypothetical protein
MASVGRKVADPKCSDITKTYRYRTINKFVDKARELGLDKNQMQALVKEIIKYSKEHKLLHRGTSILNMSDVFSICCKRLEVSVEATDNLIAAVKASVHLIEESEPLHAPDKIGGYSKLTCLINSDRMPVELLALSKQCVAALRRLPSDERSLFPSDTDLLKVRVRLLMDKGSHDQLKEILGKDLLDSGVPL